MNYTERKSKEFLNELSVIVSTENKLILIEGWINHVIKEVQKDTRHSCAEKVGSELGSYAHNLVMNTEFK